MPLTPSPILISGRMAFPDFARIVEAEGLCAVRVSKNTYRIEGGVQPVNFFPRNQHMTLEMALHFARHGRPENRRKQADHDRMKQWKREQFACALECPTCGTPHLPCALCGRNLNYMEATVDHIQPLAYGGEDAPENYQIACAPCNKAKGARWSPLGRMLQ